MTAALAPLVVVSVLVAGAVGAVLRYALSRALPVRPGHLPGGILIVNVVGSAVDELDRLHAPRAERREPAAEPRDEAVSYTHLTLPTN